MAEGYSPDQRFLEARILAEERLLGEIGELLSDLRRALTVETHPVERRRLQLDIEQQERHEADTCRRLEQARTELEQAVERTSPRVALAADLQMDTGSPQGPAEQADLCFHVFVKPCARGRAPGRIVCVVGRAPGDSACSCRERGDTVGLARPRHCAG